MSLPNHFPDWIRPAAWISVGVSTAFCLVILHLVLRLPVLRAAPPAEPVVTWTAAEVRPVDWSIFQSSASGGPSKNGGLASRFRLAGTFFAYHENIASARKAIVDELGSGVQHILSEGEALDGVQVVRVFRDRIVLREGSREEQLWLSFSRTGEKPSSSGEDAASGASSPAGWEAGEPNRFGITRVGEQRWVFDREHLMDYYQELMDEPERLVQTFDSLKPLYDEEGKITGYQLGIEGEADFFNAAGLSENDIVRSVNSVPMTNRRRAEYFIHEFVANRANAFVLQIERGGETRKLIYQMR